MDNIEANAKINKLEAERYKIICDMNSLQQRIIFINQQLSTVRRTFKMEGWRLKKTVPEKELTKEERERIMRGEASVSNAVQFLIDNSSCCSFEPWRN